MTSGCLSTVFVKFSLCSAPGDIPRFLVTGGKGSLGFIHMLVLTVALPTGLHTGPRGLPRLAFAPGDSFILGLSFNVGIGLLGGGLTLPRFALPTPLFAGLPLGLVIVRGPIVLGLRLLLCLRGNVDVLPAFLKVFLVGGVLAVGVLATDGGTGDRGLR